MKSIVKSLIHIMFKNRSEKIQYCLLYKNMFKTVKYINIIIYNSSWVESVYVETICDIYVMFDAKPSVVIENLPIEKRHR